jgi:alcohol dehydrogenase class IV
MEGIFKMSRFTLPRDIYYGKGCLEQLKTLNGKRAMLVVGGGAMKRQGFLEKAITYLKEAGMEVEVFEGVEPDPSVETVMKGAQAMRNFEPDWIVSMGGGSPIDAAKAMWAFYEYPDVTFEELCIPFNFPKLRTKAKFAAIPSTSGTATEVTAFSVITNYQTGVKYPLADFEITPDIAIVDSELVEKLPAEQIAYTGMDALTHAIEAYVSTLHGVYTDPLAVQAIEMVFDYLLPSYKGNMEAREQMHNAQCLAGMAFSNALLGIVHSMAHKTGAAFSTGHIPHGCANAMYLPYVIRYNAKDPVAASRYASVARKIGLEGNSEKALINRLCEKIEETNAKLQIPQTLQAFGIKEDEFLEKVAGIAERAVGDACTGSNPRTITPVEMELLFRCIYYGTEVDF